MNDLKAFGLGGNMANSRHDREPAWIRSIMRTRCLRCSEYIVCHAQLGVRRQYEQDFSSVQHRSDEHTWAETGSPNIKARYVCTWHGKLCSCELAIAQQPFFARQLSGFVKTSLRPLTRASEHLYGQLQRYPKVSGSECS